MTDLDGSVLQGPAGFWAGGSSCVGADVGVGGGGGVESLLIVVAFEAAVVVSVLICCYRALRGGGVLLSILYVSSEKAARGLSGRSR